MFHICIFLEFTHTLHSRILSCHLTKLYSVQDHDLSHLPRAESVARERELNPWTSHHSEEANLTGPQGRPTKLSSHIHQKGDHNLDSLAGMVLKNKQMKQFWELPSRQIELNKKRRKNVILVYVPTFRRGKKFLRHTNRITCNIKICFYFLKYWIYYFINKSCMKVYFGLSIHIVDSFVSL